MFASGRGKDLNIRGAFVHMAADAAVSAGVVLAALAIRATGQLWIDPAVSLGIVAVIAAGSFGLLRDSLNLALDAVPRGIDVGAVERHLLSLHGVTAVHDLHIWALSTTSVALTGHLAMPGCGVDDAFLGRVSRELHERFGIDHATIQVEHCPDGLCPVGRNNHG
jgi:cobalt-zinc-cadmium efflux system protein